MRLSELRPCDSCGSPLFQPSSTWFAVVDVSLARIDETRARLVMGVAETGRVGLADAEAALPGACEAVEVLSQTSPSLGDRLFICQRCNGELLAPILARRAVLEGGERKAS